ncbi:sulfatase-like hydrolase/transferase, partial [Streptomyces pactum]|nr:sulfatase-like hydrolase/transferase [Streptomyces pactum]MBH5336209.1 sulfatase-like hydrolase/transferase [Streptomyces pactum]MBH5338848.1 sulfatase-like hydrolase/transferase [Streptomyces pactum]
MSSNDRPSPADRSPGTAPDHHDAGTSGRPLSRRGFGQLAAVSAGAGLAATAATGLAAAEAAADGRGAVRERPFRAATHRRSPRPNILFILADDLGWADLSSYGSPHIHTPHLDRLARQGVRFTHAYAGSSTCSPTRFSLYTGRFPGRTPGGLHEPIPGGSDAGLPPNHPTLASLLRGAGYATALIGKWHCGYLPDHSPTKSGWETFFGNFGGALEYYSKLGLTGEYDLYEGEVSHQDLRYYTRIITERAAEYIGRDHRKPWLLNLNFTTPHWPWIAEGDTAESARVTARIKAGQRGALNHRDGGSLEKYRELVEDLDRSVGEVLAALRRSGQEENTLVVFASDNGGERFSYQWPLSGEKFTLLEGGIRVPTIVRWPARIDGGAQVSHEPVYTPDWTATLLEVGGARPDRAHPLDGTSLAGYLLRGEELPERDLFWRVRGERALRRGAWKYHRDAQGRDHLFNIPDDPREQADRAALEPERLASLRTAWERTAATLLPYPAAGG